MMVRHEEINTYANAGRLIREGLYIHIVLFSHVSRYHPVQRPSMGVLTSPELSLPLDSRFFDSKPLRKNKSPSVTILITALAVILFTFFRCCSYFDQRYQRPHAYNNRNPAYLIQAHNGAVASENKRCSDIGVQVLKDGGNAVDAIIAATFCTGVVNMFS